MLKSVSVIVYTGAAIGLSVSAAAQSGTGGGRFAQPTVDQPLFAEEEETAIEPQMLDIGQLSPSLDGLNWLNTSDAVTIKSGQITVITFFATWCKPSRAALPRLNQVETNFRDYGIRIVGISNESPMILAAFLAQEDNADDAKIAIAANAASTVWDDFMTASQIDELPTTFIVGRSGIVEWIGHPFEVETALQAVVHDTWDRDRYKEIRDVKAQLIAAHKAGDFESMNSCYDQLIVADVHNDIYKLQKGFLLATELGKVDIGYQLMQQGSLAIWDDADALNRVAWQLLRHARLQEQPTDLPLRFAERANDLSERVNPHHLDTLARIVFATGDYERAVRLQEIAVKLTTDEVLKAELEGMLSEFRARLTVVVDGDESD